MKKKSKSQAMKKAWNAFSKYIRNKYAVDGFVQCVTCPNNLPIAQMQAGHYISTGKHSTKFDERNVHPQCYACNIARNGNYPQYALFLTRTYGINILEELERKSKQIKKYSIVELEEMIETWKQK